MQKLIVQGGNRLTGEVNISGAKNSVLPILSATVLCGGCTVLKGSPKLSDVYCAMRILNSLGCNCRMYGDVIEVKAEGLKKFSIDDDLMRCMRGSVIFLGSLLGRMGECVLSFPGGCELGPRPIDMHLAALKQMGVKITEEGGGLHCSCREGLHGEKIHLGFPSVGATENIILAAVLAKGRTVIYNAAKEPEIADLANFLNACGGKVSGAGSDTVTVYGVKKLRGCEYTVMPDRIEAATFLAMAAATRGELALKGANEEHLGGVIPVFEQMGCKVYSCREGLFISAKDPLRAVKSIRTMPYPGFPTDAQPLVMAALAAAKGTSVITETIFENRYRHVDELSRMGADIKITGKTGIITGVKTLHGAKLKMADLRGGAALVTAALGAVGESEISDVKYIDRGYENLEEKLRAVGGNIKRINK